MQSGFDSNLRHSATDTVASIRVVADQEIELDMRQLVTRQMATLKLSRAVQCQSDTTLYQPTK